jgi:hypothetical protein
MAKDPAFLFYYQDFFTGISDLSNEEAGAYIRCLCIQASKGGLTEKHMKIICESSEVHNAIKSKFIFDESDNLYKNERLILEIEKRKAYSESRSQNRKGGNKKPKKPKKNISKSYFQHMENENENENVLKIEKKNGVIGERKKTDFLQSDQLFETTDMHNQLPKGTSKQLAPIFVEMLEATGRLSGMEFDEMRKYFYNWAKFQAPKMLPQGTKTKAEEASAHFDRIRDQMKSDPEKFFQTALKPYLP